jgi:hypothetical protein
MSTPRKKRSANKPVPIAATERAPALAGPDVLTEVRGLILTARGQLAQAVNAGLTMLYWQIGTRIQQDILKQKRAEYGKEIVSALGRQLSAEFGRGFDEKSLRHMLKFAEAFPDESIVSALRRQLAWTHFKQIIYIDDPLKRDFYAEMCRVERWSTRTLQQKIGSMLYEHRPLHEARPAHPPGAGRPARTGQIDAGPRLPGPLRPRFPRSQRHLQ